MIGSLNTQSRQAVVIGAGFSGLLMAYELDRHGFEVTLIEEKSQAGGLIHTRQSEAGISESAAHSFLATDEVLAICNDLGVELVSVRPNSRARFILRNGVMRTFPLTFLEAIKAFLRAYFVLSTPETSQGCATLEQWGERHLGRAAVQHLLSPFLTGVYACKPSEVTVGAAFPALEVSPGQSLISMQLRKLFTKLFRGTPKSSHRKGMMAPRDGMGALTEALQKRLEQRLGERFKKGVKVETLPHAANVIVTIPAHRASKLFHAQDPTLSKALSEVSYSPLVTVTIFAPRTAFKKVPRGVGVLISPSEERKCLGVLFNSSAFSGRVSDESRSVSLTMMLGGTSHPELVDRSEDELRLIVLNELQELFEMNSSRFDEVQTVCTRWSHAIPQYNGRLMDAWKAARLGWCSQPGRVLFGNYTGQVSLRGMMQLVYAIGSNLAAGLHV